MSWCPSCSHEINSGGKKCPGCRVEVRRRKGKKSVAKYKGQKWVTIRSVPDTNMAALMKTFLESNGWDVAIRNGEDVLVDTIDELHHSVESIDIFVPEEDARESASALRSVRNWSGDDSRGYTVEDDDPDDDEFELYDDSGFFASSNLMAYDDDDFSY